MKLLNYTSRYFIALILALSAVLCALLYFSIQETIYEELDEYLVHRQQEIMKAVQEHPSVLHETSFYTHDFAFKKISKLQYDKFLRKHQTGEFEDTRRYLEWEGEKEPFRTLESVFSLGDRYYKLTVFSFSFESKELFWGLFLNILVLFVFAGILLVLLNRFLLQRIWTPFYANLRQIQTYQLDKSPALALQKSSITEFQELNRSMDELVQNSRRIFESQKQFTENASHEMQTPLAVIRAKIDLLVETVPPSQGQAEHIGAVMEQVNRLSRLNKTLLLLSKIENNQFEHTETIEIDALAATLCEEYQELMDHRHLQVSFSYEAPCFVSMNKDLAYILLSNLLQNAVRHNVEGGSLHVCVKNAHISVSNSGKELRLDPSQLFERFTKNSENPYSNGLGLALVKTICQLYHFTVTYSFEEDQHVFSILF